MSLVLVVLMAAPATAAGQCRFAAPSEAKAMAERAAAYLETAGWRRALPAFMDPGGSFIDRDLYVFVIDHHGLMLASGGFPQSIGANAFGARDSRGRFYIQTMIRLAQGKGRGWVQYEWFNPCTGEMSPKSTYVIRVGPLIVGVGAYGIVDA